MTQPDPVRRPQSELPDRSWQDIRDAAVQELGAPWTDHNQSDPGITMLEAAAVALADIHYRVETHEFEHHHVSSRRWRPGHWTGIDLASPSGLGELAEALAADSPTDPGIPVARVLDAFLEDAPDRRTAAGRVIDAGLADTWTMALAMVRLARQPLLHEGALQLGTLVADAIDTFEQPEQIFDALRADPAFDSFWDEELDSLIWREMLERKLEELHALADTVSELTNSGDDIVAALTSPPGAGFPDSLRQLQDLVDSPLMADDALAALAHHPCPTDWPPERFERPDGTTLVWPPHPIQIRLTEPVTADDYARLALGHAGVVRAWTRSGRYRGVGWDGEPLTADEPAALGAITIVVEPSGDDPDDPILFLREVLGELAGPSEVSEADDPHRLFRADTELQVPRRVLCDEVGAALIRKCEVVVKATLHVAVGVIDDRNEVIGPARARVAKFLEEGRPESRVSAVGARHCPDELDGPWPIEPTSSLGWNPGEPIRITELIEVLSDDPLVLGVEDVQIRQAAEDSWFPSDPATTPLEFELEPVCVPHLASHCITVAFDVRGEAS